MMQKGLLSVLATLMVASAVLRVAGGAEVALAWAAEEGAIAANCPPVQETEAVLAAMAAQNEALSARENDVKTRELAVASARSELETRMVELTEAEARLSETIARAEGATEADIEKLTLVYAAMKPKDAAALFETMDPTFAGGFLIRMSPDIAAAILAGLEPEKAYEISVMMASRNAEVPKD